MTITSAKVIADSVSPEGVRLTSIEVTMHRFVLAEANTHRVFSRNSASSRARPVSKVLDSFEHDLASPIEWPSEQPGMQGGTALEGDDLVLAQALWLQVQADTVKRIRQYLGVIQEEYPGTDSKGRPEWMSHALHKSLVNRLMEWGLWHVALISSTEWDGFWAQRSRRNSKLAQPEMAAAADSMYDAFEDSTPTLLSHGEWHLPYVHLDDYDLMLAYAQDHQISPADTFGLPKRVSSSRCARTSYLTQDGKRDIAQDIDVLYNRLTTASPLHASPLEHPATPVPESEWLTTPGNFLGYRQHRHEVEPPERWARRPLLDLAALQQSMLADLRAQIAEFEANDSDSLMAGYEGDD